MRDSVLLLATSAISAAVVIAASFGRYEAARSAEGMIVRIDRLTGDIEPCIVTAAATSRDPSRNQPFTPDWCGRVARTMVRN
jgi:hypothetical protein